jgi:hypothetical protein
MRVFPLEQENSTSELSLVLLLESSRYLHHENSISKLSLYLHHENSTSELSLVLLLESSRYLHYEN